MKTLTYQEDFPFPKEYLEQISGQGTEYLPELIRILVNAAMPIERQKHFGAGWHELTPERQGYANCLQSTSKTLSH